MDHAVMRRALVAIAVATAPAVAAAQRPSFEPADAERTFARPGGPVVVHYAETGADAVLPGDADDSGVPDFVEEVADVAADSLRRFAEHGFRPVIPDPAIDGDPRLDIYLLDFARGADGQFVAEGCGEQPFHCTGHVVMENDFVGFRYPTPSVSIRILVSHELFHAVQAAYDLDQPGLWHEGTAVWAEELLYPEQDDFEHLVAGFLAKPFRPFELSIGGFGDPYPYGGALWPYFLQHRFGVDIVAAIWARCEDGDGSDPDFVDAAEAELATRGASLADVFVEFTRWNAETGEHAVPGRYPDAGRLPAALREPALAVPGTASVALEGLSARYLPIAGAASVRVVIEAQQSVAAAVRAPAGSAIARAGDDAPALHHELTVTDATGPIEVIVTGPARGVRSHAVTITAEVLTVESPGPGDGSCSASDGSGGLVPLLWLLSLAAARRRR